MLRVAFPCVGSGTARRRLAPSSALATARCRQSAPSWASSDLLLKWLGKIGLGNRYFSLKRDDRLPRNRIALPPNLGLELREVLQMGPHHRLDEAVSQPYQDLRMVRRLDLEEKSVLFGVVLKSELM